MTSKDMRVNQSLVALLCIAAIVLVGLALRTIYIGTFPFEHGDDISTAWATTWYYPRDWVRMFRLGQGTVEPNPIGMITLGHGPLQAVIAYAWVTLVALFGIHISEFVWHLPFALLGSFAVFMVYSLGSTLQSRRAGILAALFVSVIPLHVAFSRTSGESHFILASLLQVTSIYLWWRYLGTKKKLFVLATGIFVALDMLTDFAFPGLILTLIFSSIITNQPTNQPTNSSIPRKLGVILKAILSDFCQWRFIVPVAVSTAVHVYALLQALRSNQAVGMFGRLLSEGQSSHTRVGGFFLISAIENLIYATSIIATIAVGISILAFLFFRKGRTLGASVAIFWAFIYLLPFVFLLERGRLIGHFIPISVALCFFLAFVFDKFWDTRRVMVGLAIGVVAASLFLSTISTIFGIAPVGIFYHAQDHGHVGSDRGTKAAALWIRQNQQVQN